MTGPLIPRTAILDDLKAAKSLYLRVHDWFLTSVGRDLAIVGAILALWLCYGLAKARIDAEIRIHRAEAALEAQEKENTALQASFKSDSLALALKSDTLAAVKAAEHRDSLDIASIKAALSGNHPADIFRVWGQLP